METYKFSKLLIAVLMSMIIGCAGNSPDQYRDFRTSAGEANESMISGQVQKIIDLYQYEIVRFEESNISKVWETAWKARVPFDDERSLGILDAQTKIIIQARPKSRSGASPVYRVYINAQNMVRLEAGDEWIRIPNTKQYSAYIREMASTLRSELDMTPRVFD